MWRATLLLPVLLKVTDTHAAVGIIWRGDNEVLMQRRRPQQTFSGYWEFPGGKIQFGETPAQALCRELQEELGITVTTLQPWLRRRHQYPHGNVMLHFFHVRAYAGVPYAAEGQQWQWTLLAQSPSPLLPANLSLWKWLSLPSVCAVTAAEIFGVEEMIKRMQAALANRLKLVQLRDKNISAEGRRHLATTAATLCRAHQALLLINDDEQLARDVQADGVHLSSGKLAVCDRRPDFLWAAASCHHEADIAKAVTLGLDFVVLSPVNKTLTHVKATPLGWERFAEFATTAGLPVYALGGMTVADIAVAQQHSGQGIGMMRQAWNVQ